MSYAGSVSLSVAGEAKILIVGEQLTRRPCPARPVRRHQRRPKRAHAFPGGVRAGGFTLVELLVALLVAAVLLGVGVPGLLDISERNRLETVATRLTTSLISARSEALKRNQPVIVCKSANGSTCIESGGWERGWMTFADSDLDGDKDGAEGIIAVQQALPKGDTVRVSGAGLAHAVTYFPDGTASGTGVFVVCNKDGDTDLAREIEVSATGRPVRHRGTETCTP